MPRMSICARINPALLIEWVRAPTNQVFVIIDNERMQHLSEKVEFGFWEKYDENHTVIRFATSWATTEADVNNLIMLLAECGV